MFCFSIYYSLEENTIEAVCKIDIAIGNNPTNDEIWKKYFASKIGQKIYGDHHIRQQVIKHISTSQPMHLRLELLVLNVPLDVVRDYLEYNCVRIKEHWTAGL